MPSSSASSAPAPIPTWQGSNGTHIRHKLSTTAVVITMVVSDRYIALSLDDRTIHVFTVSGDPHTVFRKNLRNVWSLALHDDALLSGEVDGDIRYWDLREGKLITTMTGHIKTVRSVKFTSPKTAVSASKDGTLRMWDLKTGVCQAILTSDPGERIIDMVATTQYAVSGGHNGTAKVWSLQEHKQLFTLSDHTKLIYRVACQDNKIFTGSLDHDVRVWDLKTGETLAALKGHDSLVSQITMHEDALVTGGADGKIIIWSLLDYAPLHTISKAHENAVTSLDVRNGQILSGGSDGAVKLWDLHTGEVVGDLGMLTQAAWRVSLGRGENRSVIVVSAQGVSGSSAHFDACLDIWLLS